MAKTYTTTVYFKDGNQEMSLPGATVYQQAHSHQDIHTVAERNGQTFDVFIPWDAVAYFTFTIGESETPAPEDAFCAE